jgi:hypothetical protein
LWISANEKCPQITQIDTDFKKKAHELHELTRIGFIFCHRRPGSKEGSWEDKKTGRWGKTKNLYYNLSISCFFGKIFLIASWKTSHKGHYRHSKGDTNIFSLCPFA